MTSSDPYLGRESLYHFDQMIIVCMEHSRNIASWTRANRENLTNLQRAACEIIPHSLSIALSVRELVRTGYLLSAEILMRPLVERVAVISYLADLGEDAVELWARGWPYRSRPPLAVLLAHMSPNPATKNSAKEIVDHFNSLVHADPAASYRNVGATRDGTLGFLSGPSISDPEKCDDVCFQVVSYLVIVAARMVQIFPEAKQTATAH